MESMDDSEGDTRKNGLIAANNLNYVLEPDLSVAVNVTYKDQAFQNSAPLLVGSAGARSQCLFNTGADYIDMHKSYLCFQFSVSPIAASTINSLNAGHGGSMLNLIERLTVSSRSGDELCRIANFNQWCSTELPYRYDSTWWDTVGSSFYGNNTGQATTLVRLAANTTSVLDVSIPCYLLAPLFEYPRLLPSMLMSGLRIEIEWAPLEKAFMTCYTGVVTNAVTDYTLLNLSFNLRSIQLTDSLQRSLNEQSATNGLEIVYADIETMTQTIPIGSKSANVEIRKACSRALRATARIKKARSGYRSTSDEGKTPDSECPFESPNSESCRHKMYQWQLGSLYFPHQPIASIAAVNPTTGTGNTESKAYCDTLSNFDCIDRQAHMYPAAGLADFYNNQRTYCVCLERSSLFNLSGMPINNSRTLVFHFEARDVAATEANYIMIHLKYVKLARVFLNNIEVEQ